MYFEYLFVLLMFGIRPIIYKYMLPTIQIESIVLISGVLYALLASFYILFITPSKVVKDLRIMNQHKGMYVLLLASALLSLFATYFYLYLLKDLSAFLVTAMIAAYPLVTAAAGYLFLNESVTFTQFIGIVIIVCGVGILNLGDFDY